MKQIVALFQINEDRLFKQAQPEKPDFKLEFPERLTKKTYLNVVAKIFAVVRFQVYKEIRNLVRNREKRYVTKNETKAILESLNILQIRMDVFRLYGFADYEYESRALKKAYYTYMSDSKFAAKKQKIAESHEKYMTAILICDVFPGLEKNDPLSSPDEDEVPARFNKKNEVVGGEDGVIVFENLINEEGEVDVNLMDDIIDSNTQNLQVNSIVEGFHQQNKETILKVTAK